MGFTLKKILLLLSGIVLAASLLAGTATAGSLTFNSGPSFLPNSAFTDNNIDAELFHNPPGFMGDVVRLFGDSKIAPATPSPRIVLGGGYNAQAGDVFSIAYNFTINLDRPDPITLTIGAQAIVMGSPQTFSTQLTINPGIGHYQGTINGITFALASSGTWQGQLNFNFGTSSSDKETAENPDPNGLLLKIRAVDFRLTAVPEPSSWMLLGTGAVAFGFLARRRRRA